ncbi:MAG TPA: hypothetical protein PLQ93_11680 [Bacteroidia bacterium]|nr:hypothetical protein [Bacteroidia bacterium]
MSVRLSDLFILYIDPGTGSLLLQILAGSLIASVVFFKKTWYAFLALFKRKPSDQDTKE